MNTSTSAATGPAPATGSATVTGPGSGVRAALDVVTAAAYRFVVDGQPADLVSRASLRNLVDNAITAFHATVTTGPDGTITVTTTRPGERPRPFQPAPQEHDHPACTACGHFEHEHQLIYVPGHCGRGRFTTRPAGAHLPDGHLEILPPPVPPGPPPPAAVRRSGGRLVSCLARPVDWPSQVRTVRDVQPPPALPRGHRRAPIRATPRHGGHVDVDHFRHARRHRGRAALR